MSHALYRFYDDAGQLLYVGITSNPERRFGQHSKDKDWWQEVRGIAIEWYDTQQAVQAAERRAVRVEQPVHNKALRRRPIVALPTPVPDPLPWEDPTISAAQADFIETFECLWTSSWWDCPGATDKSRSRYRHDGRLYAARPADWPELVSEMVAQGIDPDRIRVGVEKSRSAGPDGAWDEFVAHCMYESVPS